MGFIGFLTVGISGFVDCKGCGVGLMGKGGLSFNW